MIEDCTLVLGCKWFWLENLEVGIVILDHYRPSITGLVKQLLLQPVYSPKWTMFAHGLPLRPVLLLILFGVS